MMVCVAPRGRFAINVYLFVLTISVCRFCVVESPPRIDSKSKSLSQSKSPHPAINIFANARKAKKEEEQSLFGSIFGWFGSLFSSPAKTG